MPIKPETILRRVKRLPECQSRLYLEFKDWLEDEQDNSERNWLNYFKVLALFSDHIGPKRLEDVTKYAGWNPNTKRRATYIHMSGKEISNPLLEYHGIQIPKKPKSTRKECSKCGFINTVEASICSKCSFVLNTTAWETAKLEEEQEQKDLKLKLSALE